MVEDVLMVLLMEDDGEEVLHVLDAEVFGISFLMGHGVQTLTHAEVVLEEDGVVRKGKAARRTQPVSLQSEDRGGEVEDHERDVPDLQQ